MKASVSLVPHAAIRAPAVGPLPRPSMRPQRWEEAAFVTCRLSRERPDQLEVPQVGSVAQPGSYAGSRLSATQSNSEALKRAQRAGFALGRTRLFGLWSRRPRVRVPSPTPFSLHVALFLLREDRRGVLR